MASWEARKIAWIASERVFVNYEFGRSERGTCRRRHRPPTALHPFGGRSSLLRLDTVAFAEFPDTLLPGAQETRE